ncbi:MAG: glutamine-hydrolyzing GMP synthase [Hallerella succinigenes]|uniref:glutamine-hydrolyzing GMP synthase n=1 Tax=Hallerella succinigenes TaxID=1896222 RepID=UPI0023F329C7|nr:glutamine-hydrolyzing GMP synthase [Hallerella succinigenes]MDD6091202.1 glutamine-hydrolyzing GMP synthase [Hallerella succinigenes]
MKNVDTIAVLDFGGQYAHLIANRVRRLGVFTEIHSPSAPVSELEGVKGIIYSGGPSSVYAADAPEYNPEILSLPVPKLGICYGHQLIAQQLGGHVEPGKIKEYGIADLIVGDENCPLLKGLPKESPMWMSHGDQVTKLPEGYKIVASTKDCAVAAVAFDSVTPDRQIYGIQFHPEVTHSKFGMKLLENFVDITGAQKTWNMKSYLPLITERIQEQVKDRKVFLLVSGGVDSTVAFVLLNRVLGPEKVLGLHVDNGMMRLGESQKIMDFLTKEGMNNLKVCDASEHFLEKLKGVTAPETKRGIIGKEFLTVKDEEMAKLNLDPNQWMMAQGTIYPDTIESGGTKNADKIKTHHNRVQEVLDLMEKGLVLEPLADLYKDEVRALGEELGIPHNLVWRHPFPGPGLGVRLLCSDGVLTNDIVQFDNVKDNDGKSLAEYLQENHIDGYLLPIKSVGVQGDGRTYAQPFLITTPGLSWKLCEKFSTELANRFKAINRVIYQIGSVAKEAPELVPQYATRENFDTLRKFDNICTEFLQENDLYEKIWQMPVVSVPLHVQGKPCIVMRPVNSTEAMTANFAEIDQGLLAGLWRKFEADDAGSLWYDVTHKPPGTIEWE